MLPLGCARKLTACRDQCQHMPNHDGNIQHIRLFRWVGGSDGFHKKDFTRLARDWEAESEDMFQSNRSLDHHF